MNRIRIYSLFVAAGCIPFALTTHNGATLLGVLATITFIALTVRASGKEQQS
ncbi:hypothetical protein [uncultured Microbacterium sp.]|uniref:hypothetical protein n=1 Tax=uncultured Microbacterium sp. TaxID=191216 RepID=UPI00262854DB|nr:hypothetical protein [uncultured Microbacterium sp.]